MEAGPANDVPRVLVELGLERVAPAPLVRESTRVDRDTFRASIVRPAMGTLVSVTALDASATRVEEALEAAFGEMDRLVGILSRHDSSSAVGELNSTGRLEGVPPELARVVGRALRYHRLTGGAFDITVKPLVDLLQASGGKPRPAERREAAELVGAEHVETSGRRLRFRRSGMGITLDGIAKGYIVDRMAATLAERGVRRYLINAGGDIRAAGGKEGARPWTIGVRDPERHDGVLTVVELTDGAVATSGNYEKDYEHIVRADSPWAERSTSVSVVAPEAMAADALATSLFAMAPAAGLRLARSLQRCEYLILDGDGGSASSPGFPSASAKAGGS